MTDANIKRLIERLRQRSNSRHMLLTDPPKPAPDADCHAAADMLEQYLATKQEYSDFQQEVSDIVLDYSGNVGGGHEWAKLMGLIIPAPKPDPLVEIFAEIFAGSDIANSGGYWKIERKLRDALEARGLEIKEKGQ